MNIDIALGRILAEGKYTPSEIRELLAESGHHIHLDTLTAHLDMQCVLGVVQKLPDNKYSSQLA